MKKLIITLIIYTLFLTGCRGNISDSNNGEAEKQNEIEVYSAQEDESVKTVDDRELLTQTYDANIGSGSVTDQTEFQQSYDLDEGNGKYVDFFINNTGSVNITANINGEKSHTFNSGEEGHIYLEVKNGILRNKYTFKAVPAKNGGKISIDWIITQGNAE